MPPPIRQDFRPTPPPRVVIDRQWHRRPPDELKGVEGQLPPEGYHEVRKYQRVPFIVGPVFFGVAYALSIAGGVLGGNQSKRPDLWNGMFIPVVGPFVTLERARPTFSNDIDAALLTTVGIFQIAGLGLTIGGFFMPKRILWVMDDATDKEWDRREDEWKEEKREQERQRKRLEREGYRGARGVGTSAPGEGPARDGGPSQAPPERTARVRPASPAFGVRVAPLVWPQGGGFGVSGVW